MRPPLQVGDLVSLHTLRLRGVAYDAGCGYEELRRLPALRALHLDGCRLPACLPRLTALQHLRLRGCVVEQGQAEQAERAGVDAALRSLTHLTCLSLEQLPPAAASPQALAALRSLKALSLVPCTSCASCAGASPYAAGKGASWPPGLRSLTTTFALAAAPGLGALPQLRRLRLVDAPAADGEPPEAWPRFWRWAESHPPLAQLELAPPPPEQAAPLGKACARLVARRPALRIAQHAPGAAAPPTRGALPV